MTFWQAVLTQLGLAFQKIAGPLFAFLAGRKVQKDKERAKDDKAKIEDLERRVEVAREIDRAARDDVERERVRDKYRRNYPRD